MEGFTSLCSHKAVHGKKIPTPETFVSKNIRRYTDHVLATSMGGYQTEREVQWQLWYLLGDQKKKT